MESNPSPTLRSNTENEPNQLSAITEMLEKISTHTSDLAKSQAEIQADVKDIKATQQSIEAKLGNIYERLEVLEAKILTINNLEEGIAAVGHTVDHLAHQKESVRVRLDDLEDRARRNNFIFYGIPDERESWQDTGKKTLGVRSSALGRQFTPDLDERAHRIGSFSPSKRRAVLVKFSSLKTKNPVLVSKADLKPQNVSVKEDFSPETRHVRKKLVDFAKSLPHSAAYHLRYKKLIVNNECHICDYTTDSIKKIARQSPVKVLHPTRGSCPHGAT